MPTEPDNSSTEHARQVLDACFGPPAARAAGHPIAEPAWSRRYTALPTLASPRWLLPLDSARASQAAIAAYVPYTLAGRAMKLGLHAAAFTASAMRANTIRVERTVEPELLRTLEHATGERGLLLAFHIGAAARGHITAQVLRNDGTPVAFLKAAVTPEGNVRILRETAALRRLADCDARNFVPRILFAGKAGEINVLLQSHIAGSRGADRLSATHRQFLQKLPGRCQRTVDSLVSAILERTRCAGLEEQSVVLIQRTCGRILEGAGGVLIECGFIHGDFAPWNTREHHGHLLVFDWEHAEENLPRVWDEMHFRTQVAHLLGGGRPRAATGAEEALLPLYLAWSLSAPAAQGWTARDGRGFRTRALAKLIGAR